MTSSTVSVLCAVGACALGCNSNNYRSPAFVGSTAPQPTVVTSTIKCLGQGHASADAVTDALDAELRKGGELAPVDPGSRLLICDEMANDATLSLMHVDWEAGGRVVGPIAQSIAKQYGAKSLLVPLVRSVHECAAPAAGSKTPLQTECKETRVDVAMLLFAESGVSLWRSVRRVGVPSRGLRSSEVAAQMKETLAEVPAVREVKLSPKRE